jgi:hypothetical protein
MGSHRVAVERSLALHAEVARRVVADPTVLARARARVEGWGAERSVPDRFVTAWREVLAASPEHIARVLVEPTEAMHELRQVSPFAGALSPRARWRVLREAAR